MYPLMIAPVVAGLLWRFLLIDNFGIVNELLYQADILSSPDQIGWLSDPNIALFSVAIPDIWLTTSFMTLVLFAGLQNIPGDVIEAARIDGARYPTLLFRIIIPLLRPVIAVALIVRGIDAARAFDIILIQTDGGPQGSTTTLSLLIYRTMIRFGDPGLASAMGTVYLIVMLAVAITAIMLIWRPGSSTPMNPSSTRGQEPHPAVGAARRPRSSSTGSRSCTCCSPRSRRRSTPSPCRPRSGRRRGRWRTTSPRSAAKAWSAGAHQQRRDGGASRTVLSLVLAVPAAYAITRYRTPSGRVFIVAALVTRMVPPVAIGVPLVDDDAHSRAHRHLHRTRARTHHDLAAAVDLADGQLLRGGPRRPRRSRARSTGAAGSERCGGSSSRSCPAVSR